MRFRHLGLWGMCLALGACQSGPDIWADLVVLNGNVITVDGTRPRAEAFAVHGDKFIAVGSTSEIRRWVGESTTVIDAEGRTITPGFIDAHMHPRPTYPESSPLATVDLRPVTVASMADMIDALTAKAELVPEGQWIQGVRYEDTKLGRHPTRADLDQASTRHPIYLTHSSGHIGVANSFVLRAAGVTRNTPDPPGGAFDREDNGAPNGVCREIACRVLRQAVPATPITRQDEVEGLQRTFRMFASNGITTVVDAGGTPEKLGLYREAVGPGSPGRVLVMVLAEYLDELRAAGVGTGFGDSWVKLGPMKGHHGNSLSGRTAWLFEPYDMVNPATGERDYYGIPPASRVAATPTTQTQSDLDALIFSIHEAGFQVGVHSNGDREITMLLEAFEKALARLPRPDHRHRIEHASVVNPAILQKAKELELVLAFHSYVYEHGDKMEEFGADRWGMMHANRSALDMGIPVAGNSDYGVSAAIPLLRIQSMVTRTSAEGKVYGPEQMVSPEQAIRIWTMGSAFSVFEEDIKGSIEVGKLADFVILSTDPTAAPVDEIKDIVVNTTVVGGKVVYESNQGI
jgi:predicted amidohydrolase YtcJ